VSGRARLEGIGAGLALLVALAFVASFALGLRGYRTDRGATTTEPAVVDPAPRSGRVEVLNASGRSGVARAVTQRLRAAGFDVVFYGNAAAAHGDSTIVLDRVGRDDVARAVARELRIARVATLPDSTLFLDATVVLGTDWEGGTSRNSGVLESQSGGTVLVGQR
jgi:hypothetical protein